mmetsp:Transcript_68466/g.155107  ORF Transcript_68466/g.155107 Transcript_68466/m.155107 type:complete len:200 (-) Transcript_68466:31-630(-)
MVLGPVVTPEEPPVGDEEESQGPRKRGAELHHFLDTLGSRLTEGSRTVGIHKCAVHIQVAEQEDLPEIKGPVQRRRVRKTEGVEIAQPELIIEAPFFAVPCCLDSSECRPQLVKLPWVVTMLGPRRLVLRGANVAGDVDDFLNRPVHQNYLLHFLFHRSVLVHHPLYRPVHVHHSLDNPWPEERKAAEHSLVSPGHSRG